jgi:predicted O-methyltransferase YrrM
MQPNYDTLLKLLFPDTPYFGGATRGQQTSVLQNLLMTCLISLTARRRERPRIVEIGSWVGFTALTWAHAMAAFAKGGEIICVDPWSSYFDDTSVSEDGVYADMDRMARSGLARALFDHNVRFAPETVAIRPMQGTSAGILPTLPAAGFDLVYIDGSHLYPDVKADIALAEQLVVDGGIICGDDLNLQIGDIDEATVRQFLTMDCVVNRDTNQALHPGVTLAVAERFGRVPAFDSLWSVQKNGASYSGIDPRQGVAIIPPHFPAAARREAENLLSAAAPTAPR